MDAATKRRARVRHERAELHLVLPHVLHEPLELGGDRAGRDDEHPGDHRDHQDVGEGDRADTRQRAPGEPEPADPVDEGEQGVRQHRRQRDRDQGEAEAVQEKHRRRRQDDPDCDPDPALDRHHGFFRFAPEEAAPFSARGASRWDTLADDSVPDQEGQDEGAGQKRQRAENRQGMPEERPPGGAGQVSEIGAPGGVARQAAPLVGSREDKGGHRAHDTHRDPDRNAEAAEPARDGIRRRRRFMLDRLQGAQEERREEYAHGYDECERRERDRRALRGPRTRFRPVVTHRGPLFHLASEVGRTCSLLP